MKVKELIKVLSELDPDLNVYRHGYEGGYHDVTHATKSRMVRDYHNPDEWWYGSHELLDSVYDSYSVEKTEDGIIIS